MSLITQIMDEETRWLARQEGKLLVDMLDVYKGTIAEIRSEIGALDQSSYSHNQARAIQAQLEAKVATMRLRMSESMGKTMTKSYARQMVRERNTLARFEKTFGDAFVSQQFKGFTPVVPQRAIKKLLTTQGIAIKGLTDEVTKDVRKLGVARSLARGEGTAATVKRLQKMDLPLRKGRVHLIARMETARAGNEAKSETLRQVAKEFNVDIWQMFKDHVERSAKTRNHWISWALSGTVRNTSAGEYFEIHHAELSATKADYARITGRTAKDTGILMESFSKGRRTKGGVAHFWERGNVVPWRPKWGATFGPVKHPQGPITNMKKKDSIVQDDSEAAYLKREADKKAAEKVKSRENTKKAKRPDEKEILSKLQDDIAKYRENNERLSSPSLSNSDRDKLDVANARLRLKVHQKLFADKPGNLNTNIILDRPSPSGISPVRLLEIQRPAFKDDIEAGVDFLNRLLGEGAMDGKSVSVFHYQHLENPRAWYDPNKIIVNMPNVSPAKNTKTAVHEIAHWVEHQNPHVLRKSQAFWERRTKGDEWEYLRDLTGNPLYGIEQTKKDNFLNYYMGKPYWKNGEKDTEFIGSELISMGLEMIYENPLKLITEDSDYFEFLWEAITSV